MNFHVIIKLFKLPVKIMTIHFLYPSFPFDNKTIDESYSPERDACLKAGFTFSLIDTEQLKDGVLSISNKNLIPENSILIYRGWMLSEKEYTTLFQLANKGFNLLTSIEQYFNSHYMSNWYENVKEHTMPTVFCDIDNIISTMHLYNLNDVFVKDFVKSLTTSRGSIAHSPEEAANIAQSIKKYRGFIDGGIALRKVINLNEDCENRYFVFNGNILSNDEYIPELVFSIAKIHNAPFYTIDIGKTVENEDILIEIGDGQVSDLKNWNIDNFYSQMKLLTSKLKPRHFL